MNGMHCEQHWCVADGSGFTASHDFELPPTPTIAQIALAQLVEEDDESRGELGFTSCVYLDGSGVTRTDTFPDLDNFGVNGWDTPVHVFGRNGLARADFQLRASNAWIAYVVTFSFWDNVS